MPSTRMNDSHRQFLHTLATELVKCPAEQKAMDEAYKIAAPLVRKIVEAKYPAKDMKVLKTYKVARADVCIRLQLTAGGVEQFTFAAKDAVLRPDNYSCNSQIFPADEAATKAVGAWVLAKAAHDKAFNQKREDYRALINHTATLEQIEAIWPAASKLRERIGRALPMVLSDDVIARIKADATPLKRAA